MVGTLTAYDVFERCMERADNLLRLHTAAHGRQAKPERYMSDAHRAAIVLAVSALDAFVRTYVIDRIRGHLANQEAPLSAALKDKIKSFIGPDDLIEAYRKNDLLDRVEKAFRADFEKRSFQGVKVIAEYMALAGVDKVFYRVAKRAGVNEETLCHNLDRFTSRRHAIAHRGDYDLTANPPSENGIDKKQAQECIRLIRVIAKEIDRMGSAA